MAERRMLSRKITEHDNFTSLPATAQALYMHLVMGADDDGFCDRTNIAISNAHAKKKDLNLLVEMRYLIKFPAGIYVIKHWGMQNTLRKDRYTQTEYQEEFSQLFVKPNGAYSMLGWQPPDNQTKDNQTTERQPNCGQSGNQTATKRQPPDNHPQPQVRLGKDRVNNNTHIQRACAREEEKDPDGFEAFWAAYPRKTGDTRTAYFEYLGAINSGALPETLIEAAKALAERTKPEDFNYLPAAEKWIRNKGWLEQEARKKVSENGERNGKPESGAGKQYNIRYDVE